MWVKECPSSPRIWGEKFGDSEINFDFYGRVKDELVSVNPLKFREFSLVEVYALHMQSLILISWNKVEEILWCETFLELECAREILNAIEKVKN